MKTVSTLEERIAKLEKSNGRMKAGLYVVSLCLVGAVAVGAAQGKRTVEGERFVFKDQAGKERLTLDSTSEGPTCTLMDVSGKPSFKVVINREGFFQMPTPASSQPAKPAEKKPGK